VEVMSEKTREVTAQRIICENTVSGNPRRGWIITAGGRFIEFLHEGFYGETILNIYYPGALFSPGVNVKPGEFRRITGWRGVEKGEAGYEIKVAAAERWTAYLEEEKKRQTAAR
jgi:hypothetical protein